ncbi:type II toxin-antitoxin system ParD family antitoxin [Nocardia cyriacigeorgica]|uniref:type II toxin-antitoxin system ParD family antitoxin n=1 Tax=Nocardia cyriacigeorgica TaxID=135487 RepID=UPI001895BF62|nr:type II toxin-antitoxin system ParD family antitoxin [Nocardia cyriacigeorgica]MBF6100479.1 type II toxin-antitoxin system ParD family antitoxin [Nocardia cyriacigeorgica]MBF6320313.1 type II toxin-antitoxin system ParD family antitoxin [Nocardia cyriacigeorgica]MBF6346311.1 type II toxin-antitoxin system ParD family antitoxin [Nocardia cyriacigeorgica]MBF6534201.1 type II toxin-antitoxin system ParD family antitoxin [Nocardia cyriacigeorgica]
MERNQSKLEALRAALAAGEDSGPSTEFDVGRRIDELVAQAAGADLMDDFRAGRLVRSSGPADVSELP